MSSALGSAFGAAPATATESNRLPLLELDMFGRCDFGPQGDRCIVTPRLIKDNRDWDKFYIRSTLACSSEDEVLPTPSMNLPEHVDVGKLLLQETRNLLEVPCFWCMLT